jgi:hypothetical protein
MFPPEIWTHISTLIDDGSSLKAWNKTCNLFNTIGNKRINEFVNPLWSLVKLFPNADWSKSDLSENPWTTSKILHANKSMLDIKRAGQCIKLDKNAYALLWTNEFINASMRNTTIPFDVVIRSVKLSPENWQDLSVSTPIKNIIQNKSRPWDWGYVALNPSLTIDAMKVLPITDIQKLSLNKCITYELFAINVNREWNYDALSSNPSVDVRWIHLTGPRHWNFLRLSQSPHIVEMLEAYPDEHWDWELVSENKAINTYILTTLGHKPWFWNSVSAFAQIELDDVNHIPPLYNTGLLLNENLDIFKTLTLFKAGRVVFMSKKNSYDCIGAEQLLHRLPFGLAVAWCLERKIEFSYLSSHPKLDWNFVRMTPKIKWNFEKISKNTFGRPPIDLEHLRYYSSGSYWFI